MSKIKKSYNRILEVSDDAKQITLPDSRYYRRNGEYYPSITYVLGYYPKGKFFEDWLKKVGYSAEHIVKKAGEEGTQVHEMIEEYLEGKEMCRPEQRTTSTSSVPSKGGPASPSAISSSSSICCIARCS